MTCREILECLGELAPFEYAEKWDNVGLLVGRADKPIEKIYIALDATENVIDNAVEFGADMLLTHHPLIFSPMKRVTDEEFIGRRVVKLIANDISYVAMHTNFDIMGMADAAADDLPMKNCEVLETTFEDDIDKAGFGRIGDLQREMTVLELSEIVKNVFRIPNVKVFGATDTIVSRLAILPGSGKSGIEEAIKGGAQAYITGDIDHHSGIDAMERGLCIIDAGHYGVEKLFISYMEEYIHRKLRGIEVEVEPICEPFRVL